MYAFSSGLRASRTPAERTSFVNDEKADKLMKHTWLGILQEHTDAMVS
jgi:hypothetical protein